MSFEPFKHPIALTAFLYVLVNVVTLVTDRFAMPTKIWQESKPVRTRLGVFRDVMARAIVIAMFFSFFFAISWRPFYAFTGTLSACAIFSLISRAKFEFIREPLIFSDIALVLLVFRHKEMFYATWLNIVFWIFAFGYVFGASALFMYFEPSILPLAHRLILVLSMVALAAALWLMLFEQRTRESFASMSSSLLGKDNIRTLTTRFGTASAVVYPFLAWLAKRPRPISNRQAMPPVAAKNETSRSGGRGEPLLVVWQSESFIDMRHFGVSLLNLPNVDRLRKRSAQWGRMSSVFEGGYTLRTEFSVITGLRPDELGPDAAYPYLRAATYADFAWPNRLSKLGWSTRFVHPYDRRFFSRDRALPLLGFQAMTMIDAFDHDRENAGHYVSDMTLTKRVLDFCRNEGGATGQLLFCASMENHGPWGPDRIEGLSDQLEIYLEILRRSDAALGVLADELDKMERPVWLIFYGDHAPILKSFADPFSDPRTDYMIVPLGKSARPETECPEGAEMGPWDLIAEAVSRLGVQGVSEPIAPFPPLPTKLR